MDMSMLQDPIEGTRHFARFTLPNGSTVDGEFLLDGPQTGVVVYVDRLYSPRSVDFATLHADLPADRCLSFLKCIALSGDASHSGAGRQIQRLHLFPHFAILGSRTFSPDARIRRLGVVPDDFASIYYDFDAFGFDLAPQEHIGRILDTFEARIGRQVDLGDRPMIAYFTGRRSLFSANTAFGRVSARHLADQPITGGGPRGVRIDNAVMVLHGTGGDGKQFLRPQFADELYGPGSRSTFANIGSSFPTTSGTASRRSHRTGCA